MGVVWRATDTDLDREVAIKILPDAFADDAQRLARFEREAKLLASLSHSNVATVFGVHGAQGTRFLAMELVPGEDLAQRLRRGVSPDGRRIGRASRARSPTGSRRPTSVDVIHRDLKPANVLVAADGSVKILAVGLVKTRVSEAAATASPDYSRSRCDRRQTRSRTRRRRGVPSTTCGHRSGRGSNRRRQRRIGAPVNVVAPLLAVHPDGNPVELPEITVFRAGERMRFLPDGSGLVYMRGFGALSGFLAARSRHDEEPPADSARHDRHDAHLRHHPGRPADCFRPLGRRLGYRVDRTRQPSHETPRSSTERVNLIQRRFLLRIRIPAQP